MENVSIQLNNNLHKQMRRFILTGFTAVATDTLVYFFLIQFYLPALSKVISFLCGTLLVYLLNKFWTFEKRAKSYREVCKFMTLYTTTLGVNISINGLCLVYFSLDMYMSFFIATAVSTVINFTGQKWWVFMK